jgi:hypothetical protein
MGVSQPGQPAECGEYLGDMLRFQLDHHHIARPVGDLDLLDGETIGIPAGFLGNGATLPLGNVPWQVGHQSPDPAGGNLATFDEFQAAELRHRPDVDDKFATTGRIESRPHQVGLDGRSEPIDQREIAIG